MANDGNGLISRNKRKEKDTHPDLKGSATIDGAEYWVSGWNKSNQYGPFISLSFEKKQEQKPRNPAPDAPAGREPF